MVNDAVTDIDDPLIALALGYVPDTARAGVVALLALDTALGDVLRTTSEPMAGRLRLAWWREALERLDSAAPPAEPVLQALAQHVVRGDITGRRLARLTLGWEWLLETPLDLTALRMHAALRGELFGLIADLCGERDDPPANRVGRGWSYADLAGNLGDERLAAAARELAQARLVFARSHRWPRALRAIGAMALIARADLTGTRGARTVGRLAWHRLTGR
jgi:15-cis-phytoene synthase